MNFTSDIPGFTGGVSQQPIALRSLAQCAENINAVPSLVRGNTVRPPVIVRGALNSLANSQSFMHIINRDLGEQYLVMITSDVTNPVEVFKLDGTKCIVRYGRLTEELVFTEDSQVKAYLLNTAEKAPCDTFMACSSADYTMITNKSVTCAMGTVRDTSIEDPSAYVVIGKGVAEQDYMIYVDDKLVAAYTTGTTNDPATYKTTVIARELNKRLGNGSTVTLTGDGTRTYFMASQPNGGTLEVYINNTLIDNDLWQIYKLNGLTYLQFADSVTPPAAYIPEIPPEQEWGSPTPAVPADVIRVVGISIAGFSFYLQENTIRISRTDGKAFAFRVADSWGNQAMTGIYKGTSSYSNLPANFIDRALVQIIGDPANQLDNYWVKYVAGSGQSAGQWVETVAPGLYNEFDSNTLPHRLVRTGLDTETGLPVFVFGPAVWAPRRVGDVTTCPVPSFITNKVNALFFYRNRLGMLAGENLILSKAGDFFNFFPMTATDVVDDDPIDVAASSDRVSPLLYAVPFNKALLAVGDQVQFEFSSGNQAMTTRTIQANATTSFAVSPKCLPLAMGSNVYLVATSGNYTQIREYYLQEDGVTSDAADVTAHVPTYIPAGVSKLAGSATDDIMFAFGKDDPYTIYVYKYYWEGTDKLQSAWGKWTFSREIVDMEVLGSTLYVLFLLDGRPFLCSISLRTEANIGQPTVCTDYQVTAQGVYDAVEDVTSWTLPYEDSTDSEYVAVNPVTSETTISISRGELGNVWQASGDYSEAAYIIGSKYEFLLKLSQYSHRDKDGKPYLSGVVKLRNLALNYEDTGYFEVTVYSYGREPDVYRFTPYAQGLALGERILADGTFSEPLIIGDAREIEIVITNSSSQPCSIVGGSIEGSYFARARKV